MLTSSINPFRSGGIVTIKVHLLNPHVFMRSSLFNIKYKMPVERMVNTVPAFVLEAHADNTSAGTASTNNPGYHGSRTTRVKLKLIISIECRVPAKTLVYKLILIC